MKLSAINTHLIEAPHGEPAPGLLVLESLIKHNPIKWITENKEFIEEKILYHGGILLRNFDLYSLSEFNQFSQALYPKLLDYTYRSTPRTKLGGKIYSATEYPPDRSIPQHNENSYSRTWPEKIIFFCVLCASEGGETPIADSRRIYRKIDAEIKKRFEKLGVLYLRNYTPGIDLSWQEVFQTTDRKKVEEFCREQEILLQWQNGIPELTTRQVCQASVVHPQALDTVWFNQAHLFHNSALASDDRQSLIKELGEKNLPRNTFYGDGTPIELDVLDHIRSIYKQEMIKFKWQKSDIMILDNLLMSHGREPYKGERKVVVAMA